MKEMMKSMKMDSMEMDMQGHAMHGNKTMHGMKMYFYIELDVYFLFEVFYINSVGAMIGAFIVTFLLAIIYEGLRVFRENLLQSALTSSKYTAVAVPDATTSGDVVNLANNHARSVVSTKNRLPLLSVAHIIQTLLYLVQIVLSYVLMLIFMTYSVWLCLGVALGAMTGYFLFGFKRKLLFDVELTDHCH